MLDDDDELPEDEEEILVYVEFDGSVASNTFSNEKLHLDMIGLDKEHPIMQINGKFYEGTYQDAVGTYMFFERDKNPAVDDPVFDAVPSLKYSVKTRKVLKMNRIFVEPKTELLGDSNDPRFVPNMETIKKAGVPPRYREAALKSWEMMRNNRMDALNRYLEKQRVREEKRNQGIEPDSESDNDNPFSIYKPDGGKAKPKKSESNETAMVKPPRSSEDEEAMENWGSNEDADRDSHISTVVDPGPSTSKESERWSSPSIPDNPTEDSNSDENCSANPRKSRTKIGTTVKTAKKGKSLKKSTRKMPKKRDNQTRRSKEIEDSDWEETNEIDAAESEALLIEDFTSLMDTTEKAKTVADDDNSMESKVSKVDDDRSAADEIETVIANRKLEKQRKRDEKMRLVSEKFKKAAEETKLKTRETFEGGV